MKEPHPIEASIGMELYSTTTPGIGGRLKTRFEDFLVEEITPDGNTLKIQDWSEAALPDRIDGERSKYVNFVVQKMGLSTFDVSTILAAELRIPHHMITYAGLKDKRAVTTQMMSIPSSASARFKDMRLSRIALRDPQYSRRAVQIGDLWGNRFTIRLSGIDVDCSEALSAVKELKRVRLLNYFGVQRFGVTRPYTHLVGRSLVKRDFEEATRILLTATSEYESEQLTEARERLAENLLPDNSILEVFPRELSYERKVIRQLMKHPGDFKKALSKIGPRILGIFVHSYQSYLFNRLVSLRVKSGLPIDRPEPGDFIIRLDEPHSGRDEWLFVTEQNRESRMELLLSGEYGLAAPLPGYSTKTPPSQQSALLQKVLRDEDVTLAEFRNPEWKALDSPGGLHLLTLDPQQIEELCDDLGLVLKFRLRKGSYATVVMRELMKNHPIHRV
ncbi:MAG: tRNA pseudouridine(13) synthase TruD [Promethearchaeota archaeon]